MLPTSGNSVQGKLREVPTGEVPEMAHARSSGSDPPTRLCEYRTPGPYSCNVFGASVDSAGIVGSAPHRSPWWRHKISVSPSWCSMGETPRPPRSAFAPHPTDGARNSAQANTAAQTAFRILAEPEANARATRASPRRADGSRSRHWLGPPHHRRPTPGRASWPLCGWFGAGYTTGGPGRIPQTDHSSRWTSWNPLGPKFGERPFHALG